MARVLPFVLFAIGIWFWLRARRTVSSLFGTEAELGLLPRDRQNTDLAGPDHALEHALAEARAGRWEAGAEVMARTGKDRDWERRALYTRVLGEAAALDDAWLRAWRAARGQGSPDADAELVQASATLCRAWLLRRSPYVGHATPEQADRFHELLPEAREETARAAALGPEDPTPYIVEIRTALGFGYGPEKMRELWAEITARTPHPTSAPLYRAHEAALQYWGERWHGSAQLAEEFAAQATADAPPGTLMSAFPLIAWFDHHDASATTRDYTDPALTALVDAALVDTAAASPDHPRLPEVRHLLAYFLTRQSRHEEALEQFRLVDGYVNALPWRTRRDPVEFYTTTRTTAVRGTEARARIRKGA
ncbi:hypothetical protein OG875_10240 [Streptomyces sp. NBC_01498]|uniref:hypothetical protein n=1 Tax=Streptomyces sp. NBC_01498 TaxID=2975870 RepID=UPI002E7B9ABC|nr:hypothetical protein [Streptomyces sp. NBC_01498]WTL24943.1 hypothetical protein OG875_10240 [Streptomyces sp. NBC_01498]